MDEIDRKILAELQHNGRISVSDLAQKIGLSDSPCHRRLKALEKAGIITGYRAEINAAAVGLGFSAIVFVTLKEWKGLRRPCRGCLRLQTAGGSSIRQTTS